MYSALAIDGDKSDSHSSHLTTKAKASANHWMGGWVCPRASLNMVAQRKIPTHVKNQASLV